MAEDRIKIYQGRYARCFPTVWRTYATLIYRGLYTLWLFTQSDLKTIVLPSSIFGVLGGLPKAALTILTGESDVAIIRRLPLVVAWVWLVLLPFNIDNQRRAAAIDEDRANRPWRPLPSQRLTPDQAFRLMIGCHMVALVYSCTVGGLQQSLTGILLGNLYNELGGADRSCITKNALNALGYLTFTMGAVAVAARSDLAPRSLEWFAMLGAIVFTTVQMQDLPDIEGDAVRGRRTVPLVIGSGRCRWTVAVLVPIWSVTTSLFWGYLSLPAILCIVTGGMVAWRVLMKTRIPDDKLTFLIWNLWIVSIYTLPLGARDHRIGRAGRR